MPTKRHDAIVENKRIYDNVGETVFIRLNDGKELTGVLTYWDGADLKIDDSDYIPFDDVRHVERKDVPDDVATPIE